MPEFRIHSEHVRHSAFPYACIYIKNIVCRKLPTSVHKRIERVAFDDIIRPSGNFFCRQAEHFQNADSSGKRVSGLLHQLFALRTGQPESSPFIALIAKNLDLFKKSRCLLHLINENWRFIYLKEQFGVSLSKFSKFRIIHFTMSS